MHRLPRFALAVLLVSAVPVFVGVGGLGVGLADVGLGGGAATDGTRTDTTADNVSPSAYDPDFDVDVVEASVLSIVNDRRVDRGLARLEFDPAVQGVARRHSRDMAAEEFVGHETPDGEGLADRIRSGGLVGSCRLAGENVARGYVNRTFVVDERYHPTTEREMATALVDMWFNSPTHRENLLADDWDRQSVGLYVTANGEVYATHLFCG